MGEGINVYILFSERGIKSQTYTDPEENQKVLINRRGDVIINQSQGWESFPE